MVNALGVPAIRASTPAAGAPPGYDITRSAKHVWIHTACMIHRLKNYSGYRIIHFFLSNIKKVGCLIKATKNQYYYRKNSKNFIYFSK
jgi:hypothetical protein